MHFETLEPIIPALMVIFYLSPIAAFLILLSRISLANRHRALKRTINRVAGERDKARFGLREAAAEFDELDRVRSLDRSQSGIEAASRARSAAHRCRVAAGDCAE